MDEQLIRRSFFTCAVGAGAGLVAGALAFLHPRTASTKIDVGPVHAYDVGMVRSLSADLIEATLGKTRAVPPLAIAGSGPRAPAVGPNAVPAAFHVVRRPDGFCALSARCPHMGSAVVYRPDMELEGVRGWFRCVSHGGTFRSEDGMITFGPPPRSLDALPVAVVNGRVIVDVDPDRIIRRRQDDPPPVAPITPVSSIAGI
jgi:Rieske Fe-S protein